MSVQIERWVFTADEYHRMSEAGILSEDDRVELINGEIIKMSPIGSPHAGCVNRLTALLSRKAAQAAIVSVQNPVHLDEYSEPQPDIVLLSPREDFYSRSLATARDVLLVIEVCDSSLGYDRNVKVPLYARAGVPEVWLVDLSGDGIEAYTAPMGGVYQKSRRASRGEVITPDRLPGLALGVDEILG